MKESHRKGLASHPDLESCAGSRKTAREALTKAHVGRVLSREMDGIQSADAVHNVKGNTSTCANASMGWTLRGQRP
jgi:hypothetical protein